MSQPLFDLLSSPYSAERDVNSWIINWSLLARGLSVWATFSGPLRSCPETQTHCFLLQNLQDKPSSKPDLVTQSARSCWSEIRLVSKQKLIRSIAGYWDGAVQSKKLKAFQIGQFWSLQGVLACFQVETEMGMWLKISAWSAVRDVPFKNTTAQRKGRLNLFSELVAKNVALLSLRPSVDITRNPTTGSCLDFPLPPTARKGTPPQFYSTASFHSLIPKCFANTKPLGPDIPTRSRALWLLLGVLCFAARDGDPGQKLHPTMPGPP